MCFMEHLAEERRGKRVEIEGFNEKWISQRPPHTAKTRIVIHKNGGVTNAQRKIQFIHVNDATHLPDELLKNK